MGFGTQTSYPVGSNPTKVIALVPDAGLASLAVLDDYDSSLEAQTMISLLSRLARKLRRRGFIDFSGNGVIDMATGDLNLDGVPDLVVLEYNTSSVQIYLGRQGGFGALPPCLLRPVRALFRVIGRGGRQRRWLSRCRLGWRQRTVLCARLLWRRHRGARRTDSSTSTRGKLWKLPLAQRIPSLVDVKTMAS